MPDNLRLAGLLALAAMMRAAYEVEEQGKTANPNPGPTKEEALRVQRFLSFPPQAQEKALAYMEGLVGGYLRGEE
jgi:hypothetical protein